ncbi:uncharacterized protein PAN0_005d2655 [Moesziomyces antarcticus]|uniref:Cytochrome c oxidase subunit 12, mitochondrial n=1 Tax=Pseudozyma antarctica TaxID=84753 RepID=A0A081CCP5_PSEA2|nr:uncharacterized protein PAN0_005d2655 [Moesziomyces antarcticus]GAK64441.1 conserved hypothetical protein [Moesziomyces antarcticus]
MSDSSEQKSFTLQTASFDARFPNQNQTKHCWQNYVDYYRCVNAKGEDFVPCKQFFRAYNSLCPNEWGVNLVQAPLVGGTARGDYIDDPTRFSWPLRRFRGALVPRRAIAASCSHPLAILRYTRTALAAREDVAGSQPFIRSVAAYDTVLQLQCADNHNIAKCRYPRSSYLRQYYSLDAFAAPSSVACSSLCTCPPCRSASASASPLPLLPATHAHDH